MPVSVGAFNSLPFTDLSPPSAIKLFAIWVTSSTVAARISANTVASCQEDAQDPAGKPAGS